MHYAKALIMLDSETGNEVPPGTTRETFRGEPVTVVRATRAEVPGRSGKVLIDEGGFSWEVYAGVVGLTVGEIIYVPSDGWYWYAPAIDTDSDGPFLTFDLARCALVGAAVDTVNDLG